MPVSGAPAQQLFNKLLALAFFVPALAIVTPGGGAAPGCAPL